MNNIYKATKLIGDTYAKQIIGENEYIQSWLIHKLKHTFSVSSNIMDLLFQEKEIYESFTDSERELVELSAILHDIGRFYQHSKGRHLENSEFDHGKFAVELLKNNPDFNNPILLFAIEEHNQFSINFENLYYRNLSKHDKKVAEITAKLLRDADKLENIKNFVYNGISALHFNIPDSPLSDEIKGELIAKRQISHELVKSKIDRIVNGLSWIFDIYFESTKEQIRNLKYIEFGINEVKKYGASDEDCKFLKEYLKV